MAEELIPRYGFTDDRLNELIQLFPEVFEDGNINIDILREIIGDNITDSREKEHFGLNFIGKQDARAIIAKTPTGTLKPCPGKGINEDNSNNVYIEGDNLEVLKILRKSYAGRIKMIYIDPPYNTGKDFIYKDSFADSTEDFLRKTGQQSDEGLLVSNPKSAGRFHANWLKFLYPRLRISKDLLTEDGAIFISIGDDEVHNLRGLCNEIFGEENFIAQISIITGANQSGDGVHIQKNLEYCLVYSKSTNVKLNRVDKTLESLRNLNDAPTELATRDEMGYTVYYNEVTGEIVPKKDYNKDKIHTNDPNQVYVNDTLLIEEGFIPIRPGFRNDLLHRWRWGMETFLERIDEIVIQKKDETYGVYFKQKGFNPPKNYLNYGFGTIELKSLFDGTKIFDYPKSSKYIEYLIRIGSSENDTILDFFSGSCTTAHAILNLNKNNVESKRKFIMVQLPEFCEVKSNAYKSGFKTISEIGIERIKRVINRNSYEAGFKVLKLSKSNIFKWQEFDSSKDGGIINLINQLEFSFNNPLVEKTNPLELTTEIMLQKGFPLTSKQELLNGDIIKISYQDIPFNLFISLSDKLDEVLLEHLPISKSDHFVCLDYAFINDSVKMQIDNKCKLFTI